jgi:hypothetical protein
MSWIGQYATLGGVTSKIGTKRLVGATPWMLIADAMQWMTEAGGHHVGLRDPQHRKHAGRAVGITTALGVGACAGPVGAAVSGGLWAVGELAGEMTRAAYEQVRQRRREPDSDASSSND